MISVLPKQKFKARYEDMVWVELVSTFGYPHIKENSALKGCRADMPFFMYTRESTDTELLYNHAYTTFTPSYQFDEDL